MSQKGRISLSQSIALQAPLQLGDQVDLEQLIEKSKREEAERAKLLNASASAQAAHASKAKNGALKTTISQGLLEAFSISRAKEHERRKRKNARVPKDEIGPTRERLRKTLDDDGAHGVAIGTSVKSHTLTSAIDKFGHAWSADIELAARKLRNIFLLAESGNARVTSSYGDAGGVAYGPREGGVRDHVREAQATVSLIRARFPSCVPVIEAFLTQVVCKPDGSAIRFQDMGARFSPWGSVDAQKGVGYGLLMQTLQVLEWFLAERGGELTGRPEVAASLETAIRAGAQVMREREARRAEQRERTKRFNGGGK